MGLSGMNPLPLMLQNYLVPIFNCIILTNINGSSGEFFFGVRFNTACFLLWNLNYLLPYFAVCFYYLHVPKSTV
jgi:hypothetical protein